MCSIIGYKGQLNVSPLLVNSLGRMEYRGYDSVGIATVNSGKILLKKGVGKVADVNKRLDLGSLPGDTGVGHTRWATHGSVTNNNAHPHYGCTDSMAIVHNGIIENHKELREELIGIGHIFKSDTDSEVIAHLLEKYYVEQENIEQAVIDTCKRLKGDYAFVAVFGDGSMCGSRYNEPLIIGSVDSGYFISSDILGFLEYTNKAIYLENRDTVVVDSKKTLQIFDMEGNPVNREVTQVAWKLAGAEKGIYAHHTLKEIHEQPLVVEKATTQNLDAIEKFCNLIRNSKTVYLTGSGTSYHSALVAKHLLSNFAKIHAETIVSGEFQYTLDGIDDTSVIIAISQSGETADVLQPVKVAKQMGARILSIVNIPTSSLARISDGFLLMDCGPEVGVAATKSFTAQLCLVYTVVDRLCNGSIGFEAYKAILGDVLREILGTVPEIQRIAERLREAKDIYVIGRSIHYPVALEGALKLKELAYIHAEGMTSGELKHGPLALIENNSYVIVINPNDMTNDANISTVHEIKARGATIIGISDKPNDVYDIFIMIPSVKNIIYPIIEVLPLQILAYYMALGKNADPDYPRNLAKSVTVK